MITSIKKIINKVDEESEIYQKPGKKWISKSPTKKETRL